MDPEPSLLSVSYLQCWMEVVCFPPACQRRRYPWVGSPPTHRKASIQQVCSSDLVHSVVWSASTNSCVQFGCAFIGSRAVWFGIHQYMCNLAVHLVKHSSVSGIWFALISTHVVWLCIHQFTCNLVVQSLFHMQFGCAFISSHALDCMQPFN